MTIAQLQSHCRDAADRGDNVIVLVTQWTRLCGTFGPFGELRCVKPNGDKVVAFKIDKVLAFIDREFVD